MIKYIDMFTLAFGKTLKHMSFSNMKNIGLLVLLALFTGCNSGDRGQLVGARGKKYHAEKPFGMTLIPGGSFIMGKSDDDLLGINDAPTKTVTVRSYYMDETEITNSEYRQFVDWVRDSVIRRRLAVKAVEVLGDNLANDAEELDNGIGMYYPTSMLTDPDLDTEEFSYTEYRRAEGDEKYTNPEYATLNWDQELFFNSEDYPDQAYAEVLDEMFLPMDISQSGQRMWDVYEYFLYSFVQLDIEKAARDKTLTRWDIRDEKYSYAAGSRGLEVYPDTTAWVRDFNYSYNEPMHNDYYSHEAFSDYPVVGVSWDQANAFCNWRTDYRNRYLKSKKKHFENKFRLPTEAEWEFAARGGLQGATFPWGGPYTKNDRACFLANFKPLRGDYAADQALYTVEAESFEPNDYGLYNMAGNVSEWTNSSYDAASYTYSSTMNPNVNDPKNRRKVVRGGSWKDVAYFLQVSSRDYEYDSIKTSYIGFRTIQDYLGTDITPNKATN